MVLDGSVRGEQLHLKVVVNMEHLSRAGEEQLQSCYAANGLHGTRHMYYDLLM